MTIALLLSQACGGGDDDSASDKPKKVESQKCQGGESFSCRSLTGCSGHQFCTSEGVLGACICDNASGSGSGGSSGASDAGARDAGAAQGGKGGSGQAGSDSGGTGGSAGKPADHDAGKPVEDAGHPQTGDEVCDNGKDDDGDGDIDCADDDCGTRSCLGAAPDGWDGPTALRIGTSLPAHCGGDFATEIARGGTAVKADDAECSTCTCTPEHPTCADHLDFVTSPASNCGGAPTCAHSVTSSCELITSSCISGLGTSYVGAKLPAGTQTCSPSAQSPTIGDPSWQLEMLACSAGDGLVRGGCKRDELCAPKLPNDAVLCIVHDGDVACPDGAYSEKRTFYTGFDDSRDCSACSCAQDCNYAWKVFSSSDTSCSDGLTLSSGSCAGVTPDVDKVRVGLAITGDGSCAASGGDPTGGVDPTGAITACCVP